MYTQELQSNIFNSSLRVLTIANSLQNISLKSDWKETVQKRLKTTVIKLLTIRSRLSYNLYFKRVTPITMKSILPGGPLKTKASKVFTIVQAK